MRYAQGNITQRYYLMHQSISTQFNSFKDGSLDNDEEFIGLVSTLADESASILRQENPQCVTLYTASNNQAW